jgi:hypothetical protein
MIKPIEIYAHTKSFKELLMHGIHGTIRIWMSYEEIIGFSYKGETFKLKNGIYSVTTSKHCGKICGEEKDLLEFKRLVCAALKDFNISCI